MSDLEPAELEAVQRVLAFANLGRVTDPEVVYQQLEAPQLRYRLVLLRENAAPVPLFPQRLEETGKDAARILNRDLAAVEALLQALASSPRKARTAHGQRVSELLGKGALIGVPTFDKGRVRVQLTYHASGVEAACGYGLALLYDASKPYGAALARCPLETCERWFLRLASSAGGPRPNYCTRAHQRDADKVRARDRVKAWRRAHKESAR